MNAFNDLALQPWAMEPNHLAAFLEKVHDLWQSRAMGGALSAGKPVSAGTYEVAGGVAVFPIQGTILKTVPAWFKYWGLTATSTEDVRQGLDQVARDPAVKAVLLAIDSPGGTVAGVQELADAIYGLREKKPVEAVISDLGASAAYWLASQTRRISANETAAVGSIGVYTTVLDMSRRAEEMGIKVHVVKSGDLKGAGVPGTPVTEKQLAKMQSLIDELAEIFTAAVARGRGIDGKNAQALATGETWLGGTARKLQLIDQVETYSGALNRLQGSAFAKHKGGGKMETQEKASVESAEKSRVDAVQRLRDLEAAFPEHKEFARTMWELGKTVGDAKAEHYGVILAERVADKARIKDLDAKNAALTADMDMFKREIAKAGAKPADVNPAGDTGDAVKLYKDKIAELEKDGDTAPERTVAEKFPQLRETYLLAMNRPK